MLAPGRGMASGASGCPIVSWETLGFHPLPVVGVVVVEGGRWPHQRQTRSVRCRSQLAARSCSVASVKPVFAQATLGTWALFPRHVLKDSRFASLTVDTQHGGERESGTRTERGTKERVGGVGAGGGRVGRGFFFLARLQAARARPSPVVPGRPTQQIHRHGKKYHPVEA